MRRLKGFTLIELMITVAIVAILASIALPSYTAYVQRGRITEAVAGLAGMNVNMERFFQDNRSYIGACAAVPMPTAKNFTYSCVLDTVTFTVTATGTATMAGFGYTVNQANLRTTSSLPAGWTTPAPNTCWALKADGSC